MNSQIFKNQIPKKIIFDLLDKICAKNDKCYILNKTSYKKAGYLELLPSFYESILPAYYISKQYYITRKQNYSSFVTIIRQICRLIYINYTSKIIYNKSTYDITYYIYIGGLVNTPLHVVDTTEDTIIKDNSN
jgi:hypothetical protein